MARIAFIYFFFFLFYFTIDNQFLSLEESSYQKLLLTKETHFDAVVALDGTGNYSKIMDAEKHNVVMIGEGIHASIISSNLSYGRNKLKANDTATFCVKGLGFIAKGISVKNTAGPEGLQAVAMMSQSDLSVFYQCGFFGYQDTLFASSGRQFYKECIISGTVDFIFGYAAAVFQDCQVLVRKGESGQQNTITAQGGGVGIDNITPFGFSFQFCKISAAPDLLSVINSTETFLGRPWQPYSTTVFMQSYISELLSPKGWLEWNGSTNLDTLYYGEYNNYGPGARVKNRVKWGNYHVLTTSQASNFTVAQLIMGNHWLPSTTVPYTPGVTR